MFKFWCLLLFPSFLIAQNQNWSVNPDHSEILFKVPYLKISEVTGRFSQFQGEVELESYKPKKMNASIQVSSIETGQRMRDGHLKSQEFLKADLYPIATFVSQNFIKTSPNKYNVVGLLTLAGVTAPQVLSIEISPVVLDTWKYQSIFIKFKTELNRKKFGIKWNKTVTENEFLVGDQVQLWGTLQIQPMNHKTPDSKHLIPDTNYIRKREQLNRGEISIAEFDREFTPKALPQMPPTPFEKKPPQVFSEESSTDRDFRKSSEWQIALWTMGLLGFLASIILGFFAKKMVLDYFKDKYTESNWIGLFSDLVCIIFVFIYSVAFWTLGWG
jgi:polyisoprenoid-binding protein YceI